MTTNYVGTAVLKPGFYAYQLTPGHYEEGVKIIDTRDPVLLFAGEKYEFGEASGRLFQFDLTPDVLQDSAFAPFASNDQAPASIPTSRCRRSRLSHFLRGTAVWRTRAMRSGYKPASI